MPAGQFNLCQPGHKEVPREKVVAYARALQYWAEQNDLPTRGEPHLLAESILSGAKERGKMVSDLQPDEEVFQGVTIPEVEDSSRVTRNPD